MSDADDPADEYNRTLAERFGRQLYGRRRSHKLRPGQAALMGDTLDALSVVAAPRPGRPPPPPAPASIDPKSLFEDVDAVHLEIGFGGGEHVAALAAGHPRIGFIGCEHYIDGVAKLVSKLERERIDNVRIHAHDARDLIDGLAARSVARVYLLYPDPWPKKRHHRRRFVSEETLDAVARVLIEGGELRIASDIADYVRHCLALLTARRRRGARDLVWTARRASDWLRPWPGWPGTRYEAKALREGRRPQYLIFRKT